MSLGQLKKITIDHKYLKYFTFKAMIKSFQVSAIFILLINKTSWAETQSLGGYPKKEIQKNQITEQSQKAKQEPIQQKIQKTPTIGFEENSGFFLRSTDHAFEIKLGLNFQTDGRFFFDNNTPNILEFRRVRPIIRGTLFRHIEFKFMPDFGQGKTNYLLDDYLTFNYWPQFQIQIGKFKPPVGLERLQSAQDTLFMERGLPSNLIPNRDIGIQLYGDMLLKRLTYQIGTFFTGAPDNTNTTDIDQNSGKEFDARIFTHPFLNHSISWLRGLGIGVGSSYGSTQGKLAKFKIPNGGEGVINFFTYDKDVMAAGERLIISPQLYYSWKSFSLLGEYAYNSQEVQKKSDLNTIHNQAWQLASSYVITGENPSYEGVTPQRKFDPTRGAWGALEIKARYNEFYIDSNAFPVFANPTKNAHSVKAWAVGINWYLMRRTKVMLEYEEAYFWGGATSRDMPTERLLMSRLQFAF
ncbi:phosphate-selective porin O and P [Candidatus Nitrosoglobus terrae]|uniref:Phosphate-selective porin O and P n=1 Tax=Candidatus Nitrosoglobus terrae TaxID=1630141 RepID=A0A1Q2SMW3_9GAMM|nr:porin [Candidatus Nitrosoglobus terrae]BAW80447.1 phosphate-selective porin O and P [Candidatus Nitrosoglobus terrae]